MLRRLIDNWVYGGFLAGLLLLVLTPMVARDWSLALMLVYLTLPIYMVHQYEEHDADRFHRAINAMLGGGRDVLPAAAIFAINVPLLWGTEAAVIAAARSDLGWGLIATYMLLANAIVHIVPAIITRSYNPGLVTATMLFLPLGVFGTAQIVSATSVSPLQHIVALAVAIGVHVLIVAYVLFNVRRLPKVVS